MMSSCTEDQIDPNAELDLEFEKAVGSYTPTGSKDFYIVPQSHQLQRIPQDPKNPLSPAKIELGKEAKKLMRTLLDSEETKVPKGLKATLRPYQLRGYEWMYKNSRIGFGSVIADDMGLGKTLQVITTLLKLKEDGRLKKQKALVVVPTTLLTNWDKEIRKFAPDLIAHIYHSLLL